MVWVPRSSLTINLPTLLAIPQLSVSSIGMSADVQCWFPYFEVVRKTQTNTVHQLTQQLSGCEAGECEAVYPEL